VDREYGRKVLETLINMRVIDDLIKVSTITIKNQDMEYLLGQLETSTRETI
jgi:hypothetical protein